MPLMKPCRIPHWQGITKRLVKSKLSNFSTTGECLVTSLCGSKDTHGTGRDPRIRDHFRIINGLPDDYPTQPGCVAAERTAVHIPGARVPGAVSVKYSDAEWARRLQTRWDDPRKRRRSCWLGEFPESTRTAIWQNVAQPK